MKEIFSAFAFEMEENQGFKFSLGFYDTFLGIFMATYNRFVTKEKKWQISKNLSKALIYFFSRFFVTTHFDNFFFFSSQNRKWLPNIRKLSQGRTSEKSSDATAKNLPVNRESSKPNFKVGNFYQIEHV